MLTLNEHYVILAGGVGAAKLIEGLAQVLPQEKLKIIVNTGDDIELFGLKICPDLDIITYTLANIVDKNKGWGFTEETFNSLSILKNYYGIGWFNAGDKDLATHIYRTHLFSQGFSKAEITKKICEKLEVKAEIIPMCNESLETYIKTPIGTIHFEEFFIKYKCELEVLGIEFKGSDTLTPVKNVVEYIKTAKKVIICPSNPIVSIGTILQVTEIKDALKSVKEKVFGVSPIIEGATVKGPADVLMKAVGYEVSCLGVAKYYQEFLGTFIIDNKDCWMKPQIEVLGIKTNCFDTLMTSIDKKKELAKYMIDL